MLNAEIELIKEKLELIFGGHTFKNVLVFGELIFDKFEDELIFGELEPTFAFLAPPSPSRSR